jgi:phosphatidylglycerol:prolipoprotein diacylglycerol transferase
MTAYQITNTNWGIKPVLFHLGGIPVPSYTIFVTLGVLTGILVYYFEARKQKQLNEHSFLIAFGAMAGAAVGAKILEITINIDHINTAGSLTTFLFSGRTIIGGLLGGIIGSGITKKILGIKTKKGNLFAPAVALGVAVGRIGCFMEGCCYGKPSEIFCAVDFGDGITRHPTQLYESAFMLMMFFILKYGLKKDVKPGFLFKFLMIAYFIFRFFMEFIRTELVAFRGLTFFQIISIFVLIYLFFDEIKLLLNRIIQNGKRNRESIKRN